MIIETEYRALTSAGQEGLPLKASDAVVAIGNFDGVHLGHRALLAHGRKIADENGWRLVVLTFSPHPRHFFKSDQPSFLLTDPLQKTEELVKAGADDIVILRFDGVLSEVTAPEFVEFVLKQALLARHIIVGQNFLFGKGRSGTIQTFKDAGLAVSALPTVMDAGKQRISSERVRAALRNGHVASAEDLLDRPWELRGEVVKGHQKGRTIGFPTANMGLGEYLYPQFGVYAAHVGIEGEEAVHPAIINIGQRPTIGISGPLLEAHLLDYSSDLYGKIMRVRLHQFLRPEMKFGNFDLLKDQIQKDVAWAKQIFAGPIL